MMFVALPRFFGGLSRAFKAPSAPFTLAGCARFSVGPARGPILSFPLSFASLDLRIEWADLSRLAKERLKIISSASVGSLSAMGISLAEYPPAGYDPVLLPSCWSSSCPSDPIDVFFKYVLIS
jgi:hypothetical protein